MTTVLVHRERSTLKMALKMVLFCSCFPWEGRPLLAPSVSFSPPFCGLLGFCALQFAVVKDALGDASTPSLAPSANEGPLRLPKGNFFMFQRWSLVLFEHLIHDDGRKPLRWATWLMQSVRHRKLLPKVG